MRNILKKVLAIQNLRSIFALRKETNTIQCLIQLFNILPPLPSMVLVSLRILRGGIFLFTPIFSQQKSANNG